MFINPWRNRYRPSLAEWRIRAMIRDQTTAFIEAHLEPMRAVTRDRWQNVRRRFKQYGMEVHNQSERMDRLENRIAKLEKETVRWPGGVYKGKKL